MFTGSAARWVASLKAEGTRSTARRCKSDLPGQKFPSAPDELWFIRMPPVAAPRPTLSMSLTEFGGGFPQIPSGEALIDGMGSGGGISW